MNNFTFTLSYEEMDRILLKYLEDGLDTVECFPNEPGYKKLKKAYLTIIKHNMCESEWEAFKELKGY